MKNKEYKPLNIIFFTMQSPKILVFGANGWIGGKVFSLLSKMDNIKVYKAESRADDTSSVEKEIQQYNGEITHIMSFIGRTHGTYEGTKITTIDYLEKPGKLLDNIRDNLFSPLSLISLLLSPLTPSFFLSLSSFSTVSHLSLPSLLSLSSLLSFFVSLSSL